MAGDISVKVDTSGLDEVFKEYQKWNKRTPAEIIAAKLFFISKGAQKETIATEDKKIRNELTQPSKKYPKRTLGEILTYYNLYKKHSKLKESKKIKENKKFRITGNVASKVEKFIKRRISHIQFLRSGWNAANSILNSLINRTGAENIRFSKKGAPKLSKPVRSYGKIKGGCIPPKLNQERTWGQISNYVGEGTDNDQNIKKLLIKGLNKAIQNEMTSMRQYILDKHQELYNKLKSDSSNGIR